MKHLYKINYIIICIVLITAFTGCNSKNKKPDKPSSNVDSPSVSPDTTLNPNIVSGKTLYIQYCAPCHGSDGRKGLNGAKDLTKTHKRVKKIIKRINQGKGNMPGFKTVLPEEQKTAIAHYVNNNLEDS